VQPSHFFRLLKGNIRFNSNTIKIEWEVGAMKPVIGLTCSIDSQKHFLNNDYAEAIIRAGGFPLVIPMGTESDIVQFAGMVDGLMMTGGNDPNPHLFGQDPHPKLGEVTPERDALEVELARHFLYLNKPILGICRGMQIMNVAVGGTLYQDISQHKAELIQHEQDAPREHASHYVQVEEGSLLYRLAGENRITVNSFHHQAVRDVAPSFVVSGIASDGIIEAIESRRHRFVLGVQWHPEGMAMKGDPLSIKIFEHFLSVCAPGGRQHENN
jgi:putative glutamine amidotransferase